MNIDIKKHTKTIGAVLGVIVVSAAVWTGMTSYKLKAQKSLQSQYSLIEYQFNKQKELFERGRNPPPAPQKNEDGTIPAPLPSAKASGNIDQDYGKVVNDLNSFLEKNPQSPAGAMAGLRLAGIYSEYQKSQEAAAVLEKVKYDKALLGALVKVELGTQKANLGQCAEADKIWKTVNTNGTDSFLKPEISLKQGLCAESAGEMAKAEQLYREATETGADTEAGRTAQKYLRLLKFKGTPDAKTE